MGYMSNISNEDVASLDLRGFEGEILVVDDERSMRRAEELLIGQSLLGFDTETRPSFSKHVHHTVSLLQLSTQSVAVLFRLKRCALSPTILDIMSSDKVLKVGAAIRDDIKALRSFQDFTPSGFIDLQSIIEQWGIAEKSVRKMAAIVLAIRISKAQRLSNWDATKLTPSQVDYAAMDAWVCREIYVRLNGDVLLE